VLENGLSLGTLGRRFTPVWPESQPGQLEEGIEPMRIAEDAQGQAQSPCLDVPEARLEESMWRTSARAFTSLDPPTEAYRPHAEGLPRPVAQLDRELHASLSADPPAQRSAEDLRGSLFYLGPDYGWRGYSGVVNAEFPGGPQQAWRGLIALRARALRLPAVSVESTVSDEASAGGKESGARFAAVSSWIRFRPPMGPAPSLLEVAASQCEGSLWTGLGGRLIDEAI